MDWGVKLGGIIDKCIWNGYEGDDTSEVKRMKFPHDDAEVWDRAEEMIPAFTVKGSAQLSKQHGCSNPQYRLASVVLSRRTNIPGLRFPEYCDGGRPIIPR